MEDKKYYIVEKIYRRENDMEGVKYYIVEICGHIYQHIDVNNQPNKYGECKYFDTFSEASQWVRKHTYIGMSVYYSIRMKDGVEL